MNKKVVELIKQVREKYEHNFLGSALNDEIILMSFYINATRKDIELNANDESQLTLEYIANLLEKDKENESESEE